MVEYCFKKYGGVEELQKEGIACGGERMLGTLQRLLLFNSLKEGVDTFGYTPKFAQYALILSVTDVANALQEKCSIERLNEAKITMNAVLEAVNKLNKKQDLALYQWETLQRVLGKEYKPIQDKIDEIKADQERAQEIKDHERQIRHQKYMLTICEMMARVAVISSNVPIAKRLYLDPFLKAREFAEKMFNKGETLCPIEELDKLDVDLKKDIEILDAECTAILTRNRVKNPKETKLAEAFIAKESVNIAGFFNALRCSTENGIPIDWNATVFPFIAYFFKDLTGAFSRTSMFSTNPVYKTMMSLLDKVDSPIAESMISYFSGIGYTHPKRLNHVFEDFLELTFKENPDLGERERDEALNNFGVFFKNLGQKDGKQVCKYVQKKHTLDLHTKALRDIASTQASQQETSTPEERGEEVTTVITEQPKSFDTIMEQYRESRKLKPSPEEQKSANDFCAVIDDKNSQNIPKIERIAELATTDKSRALFTREMLDRSLKSLIPKATPLPTPCKPLTTRLQPQPHQMAGLMTA